MINDFLYIQLFKKNIWNELKNKIRNNCSKCNKQSEKLFLTNMNLSYCQECMLEMIKYYTNNLIILNDFEKSKLIYNKNSFFS